MEIILMRHYKVNVQFEKRYNSITFDSACDMYNQGNVIPQKAPQLPDYVVYASPMLRARQTAKLAFGIEPINLDGVEEVTMRSFIDTRWQFPRWVWELMGRLQWRFQSERPLEKHIQTMQRLDRAIETLEATSKSSIIVMHGLAMRYMVKVLRSRGFSGPTIIHAKNGACYHYKKVK